MRAWSRESPLDCRTGCRRALFWWNSRRWRNDLPSGDLRVSGHFKHGQRDFEARFSAQQACQCDLTAGFMHVTTNERHAAAMLGIAIVRQCREAGLENQLDRLTILQACRFLFG